ncbi:MAG TPA: group 1 truncated hemoglobin [Verrucomicrobiae bacterium]|nr:group 1 truncated hemoglobin [Verrucomicrobiae bacterium]
MNAFGLILLTKRLHLRGPLTAVALWLCAGVALSGCGTKSAPNKSQSFFTSGSSEADQRASQRMAQQQQLSGTGESSTGKGKSKDKEDDSGGQPKVPTKRTLFDRLGGQTGLVAIVDDFLPRALQDPRVNWDRKGTTHTSLLHPSKPTTWDPNPTNVATLKKHIIQFLSLATGGPSRYEGREMKPVHAGMHISNPEFDAAVGDLKASLDKLQIPDTEQKELLAVIESTRAEIVTER